MCSKLFTARAGKSGSACSSPQNKMSRLPVTGNLAIGESAPLSYGVEFYHTILLVGVPFFEPQVFRIPEEGACDELLHAQGLHGQQLRRVQASGQVCQYEWTMERPKKNHIHQTTLVPLTGPDGRVNSIISVTKDISSWGEQPAPHLLKESASSRTFAQILLSARENEKREVAKALHDEIGSASVMLAALVCIAKQDAKQGSKTRVLADLDRLYQQIQNSMERLHAIIVTLRPPSLDTEGALRGSVEELLKNVCELGRIEYQFSCKSGFQEKGISDGVKILLYRMVQEALNNVIKHARATHVTVRLERTSAAQLIVTVQDDGVGFKREKRLSVKHVGLLSMRDSIRSVGGTLTIKTAPGQGTSIRAVCPCCVYEGEYEDKNCISG